MSSPISEDHHKQLADLVIDPQVPLIITDADEVLLRFIDRLEHYLERQGLWIDLKSYNLNDNIRSRSTNESVQLPNLIDNFFKSDAHALEPAPGAARALTRLSERAQIVVLTNLPLHAREARIENLAAHGMDYPLIVGSGAKGPLVSALITRHLSLSSDALPPVFFLDDISYHIDSVAEHVPDVLRIHFVADPRLARLATTASRADARIDVWSEAYDWISAKLDARGY